MSTNGTHTPGAAMNVCQNIATGIDTDHVCTLDRGHAGPCDLIDAMGMCTENNNCRARRDGWGDNGHNHNH